MDRPNGDSPKKRTRLNDVPLIAGRGDLPSDVDLPGDNDGGDGSQAAEQAPPSRQAPSLPQAISQPQAANLAERNPDLERILMSIHSRPHPQSGVPLWGNSSQPILGSRTALGAAGLEAFGQSSANAAPPASNSRASHLLANSNPEAYRYAAALSAFLIGGGANRLASNSGTAQQGLPATDQLLLRQLLMDRASRAGEQEQLNRSGSTASSLDLGALSILLGSRQQPNLDANRNAFSPASIQQALNHAAQASHASTILNPNAEAAAREMLANRVLTQHGSPTGGSGAPGSLLATLPRQQQRQSSFTSAGNEDISTGSRTFPQRDSMQQLLLLRNRMMDLQSQGLMVGRDPSATLDALPMMRGSNHPGFLSAAAVGSRPASASTSVGGNLRMSQLLLQGMPPGSDVASMMNRERPQGQAVAGNESSFPHNLMMTSSNPTQQRAVSTNVSSQAVASSTEGVSYGEGAISSSAAAAAATDDSKEPAVLAGPLHRKDGKPISLLLYHPRDDNNLSPYQIVIRKQIELFEATHLETLSSTQGRKRSILVGQIGIRCKYCNHLHPNERSRASTFYPSQLLGLYQAGQNMAQNHTGSGKCPHVPPNVRKMLQTLRADKSSPFGGGKKYWKECAESVGIFCADDRLWFRPVDDGNTPDQNAGGTSTSTGSAAVRQRPPSE